VAPKSGLSRGHQHRDEALEGAPLDVHDRLLLPAADCVAAEVRGLGQRRLGKAYGLSEGGEVLAREGTRCSRIGDVGHLIASR
jgi:hypothetical protein